MSRCEHGCIAPRSLIRLQNWLSPAFPTGSYSYSHGLEWAIESQAIHDRTCLVDWLDADLCFGSGRNDALFFVEAWRCTTAGNHTRLLEAAELATAFRATSEFALEAFQQGASCLATLCDVWPAPALDSLREAFQKKSVQPVLPIVIAVRSAAERVPVGTALRAFLSASVGSLVTAGVRLIPLGQTDGQRALAELEPAVLEASKCALAGSIDDLGSAALMVDLASMLHETQYTRLFRS